MNLSKRLIFFSALILTIPSLAAPGPYVSLETPRKDRGSEIYSAYCAACHGENGDGKGAMVGQLPKGTNPPPAKFSSWVFQGTRSDQQLRKVIRGGGSAVHKSSSMPAWGQTLTPGEVDDVVSYVRSLEKGAAPNLSSVAPLDDELKIGQALYSIRCLPCHGSTGNGRGFLLDSLVSSGSAPMDVLLPEFSLYSAVRGRGDEYLEAVISSGISHSGIALQTSNGWWNRKLQLKELRALILYLRTLPVVAPGG